MPHVADDPREISGAALEVVDPDRCDVLGALGILLERRRGEREGCVRRGGDLARDADHREEVRAVGRDLDVEHGVVEPEDLLHVPTRLDALGQDQDAVVRRRDAELVGRAQHAVRDHAADLAPAEWLGQERHGGARSGERHDVADGHVPHADHDLLLTRARVDTREAELLAVRVVTDLEHASGDDAVQPLPRALDRLDLGALVREDLGELLGPQLGRAELAEPGQDDLHATPSNCSRNRTSPS